MCSSDLENATSRSRTPLAAGVISFIAIGPSHASGRIWRDHVSREPVAFVQNVIDLENRLLAKTWRPAWTQGRFGFQVGDVLPPDQRALETLHLTRQIFEGVFQGGEAAPEICGYLLAITCVANPEEPEIGRAHV